MKSLLKVCIAGLVITLAMLVFPWPMRIGFGILLAALFLRQLMLES